MYLGYQNGKIKFYTETKLDTALYNIDKVEETQEEYIFDGEEYVLKDEDWEAKQAQKERERIALLNMTGADVERAIYKVKGIDFDDILAMVKDNPTIDEKALKIEFKANNFFRGNPYISQVGLLLGFTEGMLDKFFETKDYHYLTTCKLTINVVPEESTVTINDTVQKEVTMPYNSQVTYKIDCEGYKSVEEVLTLTEDKTLEITLEKIEDDNTDTTTDNANTVHDELQSETN